ncbi:DNA-binding protein SATB2, partial [Zootermopsis nevadensis]
VAGKSLPVHCVVEAVSALEDSRLMWRRKPVVETDSYVIIPVNTAFQDLVQVALHRLGYPRDSASAAKGSVVIKNWKPLSFEKIAEGPTVTVGDILGELTTVATLRIQLYRARPSILSDIKDKLLRLLLAQSHGLLLSSGCPLDEITLSHLCRSPHSAPGNHVPEPSEECRRKFEQWWTLQLTQQQHQHHGTQHHSTPRPQSGPQYSPGGSSHHISTPNKLLDRPPSLPESYPTQKTRMRTSFDPELELPKLQRWFAENQHPSRQQIQQYVKELNGLESRRGRKPLDINNVVYWFKNARAAQKRAELRSVGPVTSDQEDEDDNLRLDPRIDITEHRGDPRDDLRAAEDREPDSPTAPLSLTTNDKGTMHPARIGDLSRQQERLHSFRSPSPSDMIVAARGPPSGGPPNLDRLAAAGFPLVPNSMFSHSIMYMSHYIPSLAHQHHGHHGLGPATPPSSSGGLNLSALAASADERRKRNRTFIDPVTEVPRLEQWFSLNTHPSHNLILKYTEELNRMPYRQKFPRLEPKNVQFWFKNRRAKCKRLKMSLFE